MRRTSAAVTATSTIGGTFDGRRVRFGWPTVPGVDNASRSASYVIQIHREGRRRRIASRAGIDTRIRRGAISITNPTTEVDSLPDPTDQSASITGAFRLNHRKPRLDAHCHRSLVLHAVKQSRPGSSAVDVPRVLPAGPARTPTPIIGGASTVPHGLADHSSHPPALQASTSLPGASPVARPTLTE